MDELANSSPSVTDGLPWETEESFRMLGCQLIQQAGLLLKMSNSSLLTGQILFHQLYCKKSFLALPVIDGAMAALFVAGKVEECYRRARDLVNVFHWIHGKMRGGRGPGRLPYICDEYYKWRDRLTSAEMVLLSVLGFHVQPDGKDAVLLLISYLQTFEVGKGCELGQMALNILNDSFRTVCCLIYRPNVMACAAIQIAAESTGWERVLPSVEGESCWYRVFGVPDRIMMEECMEVMRRAGRVKYDPELPMTNEELVIYTRVLQEISGGRGRSRSPEGRSPSRRSSRSPHRSSSRRPQRRSRSRSRRSSRSRYHSRSQSRDRHRDHREDHRDHRHDHRDHREDHRHHERSSMGHQRRILRDHRNHH